LFEKRQKSVKGLEAGAWGKNKTFVKTVARGRKKGEKRNCQ